MRFLLSAQPILSAVQNVWEKQNDLDIYQAESEDIDVSLATKHLSGREKSGVLRGKISRTGTDM
jgi:hypothetical protein